jgi:hypothetical protein
VNADTHRCLDLRDWHLGVDCVRVHHLHVSQMMAEELAPRAQYTLSVIRPLVD